MNSHGSGKDLIITYCDKVRSREVVGLVTEEEGVEPLKQRMVHAIVKISLIANGPGQLTWQYNIRYSTYGVGADQMKWMAITVSFNNVTVYIYTYVYHICFTLSVSLTPLPPIFCCVQWAKIADDCDGDALVCMHWSVLQFTYCILYPKKLYFV